ncbi:hypothetical protein D3C80_1669670 [compost metagenome]
MAEHHALGKAGGAAGVEDTQQGVATAACILDGHGTVDQCFIVEHTQRRRPATGVDDCVYSRCLGSYLHALFDEGVINDQY